MKEYGGLKLTSLSQFQIIDKFIIKCTCIIKNSIGRASTSNMKFRTSVESEILYK